MAAARRWGAAWAWGRAWAPGQRAWSPRGAEPGAGAEPELHGALLQGRGAAGRAELAAAAGRRAGSATSSLGVPGTFTASRGVFFGCFPPLRREGELSGVRLLEAQGVAESAGQPAAARGAARGGRSHIWRRRRPPTSPSDSAAPGGFEFWLPGKGPFLGERGLSFVRLRPLRAPLQAPPRPACARDCAAALTAPFICLWSRRAAPEAGDPAVPCSRGRRLARMTPR